MMTLLAFCLWLGEEAKSDQGCDPSLNNLHALLGQLEAIGLELISLHVTIVLEIPAVARQGTTRELTPGGQANEHISVWHLSTIPEGFAHMGRR